MKLHGGFACLLLIFLLGVPLTAWAQETESATQPTYPSLKIAGFADFNFSDTDESGSNSGFNQGQFVLHFSSVLFVKTSFFAETTIAAKGTDGKESFKVGIERIFISFTHSDYLRVSFGRFHTPVNWWNTAFHHGLWLQTSIQRPEMTKFGGKFIPVHFVGVLLEGKLPAYGLNINYNLGVGNGRDSSISGAGSFGDVNNHRAWVINLFTRPDRFFGLQAGGALYHDKITMSPVDGGGEFREWITSGYIVWQRENPEVIAEIANVRHHALGSGGASNSLAYYIQVAYRLPWLGQRWKPYYRYESINIPVSEAVFTCCPPSTLSRSDNFKFRRSSIVGIRFDISHFAAIKAEYRNLQRFDLPRVNGGFAQVSLTF